MKLVFAGTPDFAVPSLDALVRHGHDILAVYTQPDRPAGRGRQAQASPVKKYALDHELPVRQPETLVGEAEALRALAPEAMIVVAYGQILSAGILEIPVHGCLNVHASLLPRWRGAAPIQRAIEAGDTQTGVTIMQMDVGLDTGPILLQRTTPINNDDTGGSLHDRLAQLGAGALVEALDELAAGRIEPRAQDESLANYASKLKKQEGALDWSREAGVLARRVRAFNPWPVAYCQWQGKRLRVLEAHAESSAETREPGTVLEVGPAGVYVATGAGALVLTRLQAEGGTAQGAGAFLNGHALSPGEVLG
jgi:methionyl-tRNA formyltransferase